MRYRICELNIGGILDQAINLTKNHFVLLLLITLVLWIPVNLATNIVAQNTQEQIRAAIANNELVVDVNSRLPGMSPWSIVLILVNVVLVMPLTNAAIIHALACEYLERPTTLGGAFARAGAVFVPLILTNILAYLATSAGLILLIIPGIIVAFRLFLTTHVVVIEGAYFGAALKRSWKLMKGNVGTFFVLALLLGVIQFAIGAMASFLPSPYLVAIVSTLLGAVIVIFFSAVWVVFYFSCRCKVENFDLNMLADAVAAEESELDRA